MDFTGLVPGSRFLDEKLQPTATVIKQEFLMSAAAGCRFPASSVIFGRSCGADHDVDDLRQLQANLIKNGILHLHSTKRRWNNACAIVFSDKKLINCS